MMIPWKLWAQFGIEVSKIAIFGKSRLKFAHVLELELQMGANVLPAITLAMTNIGE